MGDDRCATYNCLNISLSSKWSLIVRLLMLNVLLQRTKLRDSMQSAACFNGPNEDFVPEYIGTIYIYIGKECIDIRNETGNHDYCQ